MRRGQPVVSRTKGTRAGSPVITPQYEPQLPAPICIHTNLKPPGEPRKPPGGAPSPTGSIWSPRRCPHPCHGVSNILPRAHSHCAGDRSTGGVHSCARASSGNPCTGVSRSLGCTPLAWGPAQGQVFKERGRSARWRPPPDTLSPGWCVWQWEINPHPTISTALLCGEGWWRWVHRPSAPLPSSCERPALRLAQSCERSLPPRGSRQPANLWHPLGE